MITKKLSNFHKAAANHFYGALLSGRLVGKDSKSLPKEFEGVTCAMFLMLGFSFEFGFAMMGVRS